MAFSGVSILSPISSGDKTPQNPEYSMPFATPLSFNSRPSTDSIPTFSPLSNSLRFATPPQTAESTKSRGKFWKAMKQLLTCYNPVGSNHKSKQKSSRKENTVTASKTSSVRVSPGHAYSAMNDEERNESLKAVIRYCNKSMKPRTGDQRDDSRVKNTNCIRDR